MYSDSQFLTYPIEWFMNIKCDYHVHVPYFTYQIEFENNKQNYQVFLRIFTNKLFEYYSK